MKYEQPSLVTKDEADARLKALMSGSADDIARALIAAALSVADGAWLEMACARCGLHADPVVRRAAAVSLGHVARRFRALSKESRALIARMANDPATSGAASDALDDIGTFAG